jgi:D-methionine transport system substrate-binding protein
MKKLLILLSLFVLILAGCGDDSGSSDTNKSSDKKVLKVASLISPMTDILELIKPQLLEEGIELEVIVLGNNVMPNEALASKEVDANFFQHVPYMEQFNRSNNAKLVPVTPIYFANYGVYAKEHDSIDTLPDGATVAIANDISNIDRSLQLLAQHGVIKLKEKKEPYWTVKDIIENPKNLKFEEVDLLMLARMYDDADAVVMTPAYAAPLGLTPKNDALLTEGTENEFAITLVAREDNKEDSKIKKLAEAMTSPEVKKFLEENYDETAIPAFK